MRRRSNTLPVAMVLASSLSVQAGAVFAVNLFEEAGPGGTVLLRTGFAALVLVLLWRPPFRGYDRDAWKRLAVFGLVFAGMNLCFYEGLERVPLGLAVTLEFVGPLGVAIAGSRRAVDLLWVALAAAGIALIGPGFGDSVDSLGALLCLAAGGFWAAYIVISARIGQEFPGGNGLALAMVLSTAMLAPVGIVGAGTELIEPEALAAGFAIAVLSSAIPYSFELEALRTLPTRIFGVLMSLEPAIAAVIGLIALDQALSGKEVVAIALVVLASAGALAADRSDRPPIRDL